MKKASKAKKATPIRALVITLVAVVALLVGGITLASAAAGQTPAHSKRLTDNQDGTYQLELSVTGDASTETHLAPVNVLVVFDTSNSMTSNYTGSGRRPPTRADAAEYVMRGFAQDLYHYQGGNPDVEMAFITFNHGWDLVQDWTKVESDITGKLSEDGTRGSRKLRTYHSGTNWEVALQAALTELEGADNNPTFVIFVTDGAPSQVQGTSDGTFLDSSRCYGPAQDEARAIQAACAETGGALYGIYAYGSEADYLDDVIYYALNGSKRNPETDRTNTAGITHNYFNAGSTTDLENAISTIFNDIVSTMGVDDVVINDGTTNHVSATSGEIADLVEVVDGSYKYWLSIPVAGSGPYTFTRTNPTTGANTTYTVTDNGNGTCTVTWGESNTLTVSGSVKNGNFKFQWTEATELSNGKTPPAASLQDGSVKWDLDTVGTLLNGVTYSVTFDVYPSQYTYDLIAKLKNGDITYGQVTDEYPAEIWNYIDEDTYAVATNTSATLTYDDTRDDKPTQTTDYVNPRPVPTDSVPMLTVAKEWEGATADVESLPVTILMDGKPFHTATLNQSSGWEANFYISVGIIRDGQVLAGCEGHDFSFAELDNTQYRWELDAPTVHPMLIDGGGDTGEPTMLIKVDADHTAPSGAQTYTINGSTYYVGSAASSLTATNYRRSSLNLTKVVTGDAPADATFPFTVTVVNSKAPRTAPSEEQDPRHESDYWVWFSVYDGDSPAAGVVVSGDGVEGPNGDGYYYAPSGTAITVNMKAGWNLRFINLPTDTEYTIVEGDKPNYSFVSAVLTAGTDSKFSGGQTTTGTIQDTKTNYTVTYTNKCEFINVTINKVWDDSTAPEGTRPEALTLTLNANGTDVTSTYAENLKVTKSEDGNTWTYTWSGLPQYDDKGNKIEYTVTEGTVPPGYMCTGSPASPNGTITNKYNVTSVTVYKFWDDNSNQDHLRPTSLELTLNGLPTDTMAPVPEVTGTDSNTWTYTWSGLPKYDSSGKEINYTVTEGTVPDGYTCTTTTVDAGDTITNKHAHETTTVTVNKVWDDNNDQDGIRPSSVTVQLMNGENVVETAVLNEENDWTNTWTVNKYDENGNVINYTVDEADPPTDYTPTVVENEDGTWTVTNSHVPAKIDISVRKEWDDSDNVDGWRPESVVVQLMVKIDGETFPASEVEGLNLPEGFTGTLTLDKNGDWKGKWENLPAKMGGEDVEYSVEEVHTSVINGTDGTGTYADAVTEDEEVTNGYLVTNTHTPETTNVSITKVWDDENNRDGLRPSEEQFAGALHLSPSVEGAAAEITVNEDGTWTATFSDLPKYKDGEAIFYSVEEDEIDHYTSATEVAEDGTITITNTHVHETVTVTVSKEWEDGENADGMRPESVTVQLTNGTTVVQTAELNEDNDWSVTWEGLDKYTKSGDEIAYTVNEVEVTGYDSDIESETTDDGYAFTITNTRKEPEPVTSDPPVHKIVKGDPETDATFTFQMEGKDGAPMPEGATDGVMTCQITGSGSHEFGIMTYTEPGTYVYELSEINDGIEGYTYDTTHYTLTVTVTVDEETGNLTKTETVVDDSGNEVDFESGMVFTNVYEKETPPPKPDPKPEPKPVIPATGDPTGGALPVALLSLLGGGSAYISSRIRRRKED